MNEWKMKNHLSCACRRLYLIYCSVQTSREVCENWWHWDRSCSRMTLWCKPGQHGFRTAWRFTEKLTGTDCHFLPVIPQAAQVNKHVLRFPDEMSSQGEWAWTWQLLTRSSSWTVTSTLRMTCRPLHAATGLVRTGQVYEEQGSGPRGRGTARS